MRLRVGLVWAAAVLSACSPAAENAVTTTVPDTTTSSTRPPSDEICLSGDLPFSDDGFVAALGDDAGDATAISQIRWDPSATCERITIMFGTESGAPATTLGPSSVSVISYAGIVRAVLPEEVMSSAIADTLLEGSLIASAFVVRDPDGIMSIDIHGVDEIPIQARAFTTTSPASLVIDVIRADTDAIPIGVTKSHTAVVVAPTPGRSQYALLVRAYVEPGLLAIRVQIIQSDNPVVDRSIALQGYSDTWQSLSSLIETGPSGTAVLFVGTLDTNDRPFEGTSVPITME